jgi:polyketide biosynthesis enoyl-CoA hydratase PksI
MITTLTMSSEGVAVLRLQDEANKNALSEEMVRSLETHLQEVSGRDDIKVMILAGLTEYFSSGASLEVLRGLTESRIDPGDLVLPARILDVPVPTIAAMEGHAIGGGFALGICCDIVLIAEESRYGCTFMNMGFTPGMGTTRLLEHVVSPAIAHEMLFTGQTLKGKHFENRGGFNYVMPRSDIWGKAIDLATRIAEKPRTSLVLLKQSLAAGRKQIYEGALAAEAPMHRKAFAAPDIITRILENY